MEASFGKQIGRPKNKSILRNPDVFPGNYIAFAPYSGEEPLGAQMSDLRLSNGRTCQGLRTILIENRCLKIAVLPEAGAKIWQITYKPLNADLLWNNPGVSPARQPLHASYDDTWSGGWDELFPNDEAADLQGMVLPDHGELWTREWHTEMIKEESSVVVQLRTTTPISNYLAEKTLLLRPQSANLQVRYRLTNQGASDFPFLFKLHPAFAVSPSHRIDFPPMAVLLEPEFPGTLEGAPPIFPWPHASLDGSTVDLRCVPDASSRTVHFFYGMGFVSGWCGVTNQASRLAAALRFDPEFFPSCWMFASHGGWRDLNVAVLEPATGYPFRIESMIERGRSRRLAPGESIETVVQFSVQEGLTSIGGVEEDGRILPGDEI